MDQVSIWDLLEAFDAVCKATGTATYTGHIKDDTPIDLYQIEILHRLQTEGAMTFERVFESRPNRLVMVGLFLALLELIRDRLVWAEQSESTPHQVYLRALTDEPAEQAVQRAILAVGEAEGELPSSAAQPEQPPIPIAELPLKRRQDSSQQQSDEGVSRDAETTESTDADLQEKAWAAGDSESSVSSPAKVSPVLPIPIAELPPETEAAKRRRQQTPDSSGRQG
jgi:hypothetical protein